MKADDAVEGGLQRFRFRQIALEDFDAGGKSGFRRVGGQSPDALSVAQKMVYDVAPGLSGRACYKISHQLSFLARKAH